VVYVIAFILAVALLGIVKVGFAGALFSVAFIGGFALWMATTCRTPIDAGRIIVPYLMLVILFDIQVYEEYVTHVEVTLARLSGAGVTQGQFLTIAAFSAPIVWLLGAVTMLRGWRFGWFLGSSFLFAMMFAEPLHLLAPFLAGGTFHYTSGLFTAPFLVTGAWFTFLLLRREMTKTERNRAIVSRVDEGPRP
jgi:hypothetical protein